MSFFFLISKCFYSDYRVSQIRSSGIFRAISVFQNIFEKIWKGRNRAKKDFNENKRLIFYLNMSDFSPFTFPMIRHFHKRKLADGEGMVVFFIMSKAWIFFEIFFSYFLISPDFKFRTDVAFEKVITFCIVEL